MKTHIAAACIFAAALISCTKQDTEPAPEPPKEQSIPEKLEAEVIDIAGRGWDSLADTLYYFSTNILEKGKLRGYGPDGVYYELSLERGKGELVYLNFSIADSVHLKAHGSLIPLSLSVYACGTELLAEVSGTDSLKLEVGNVGATLPRNFLTDSLSTAPLRFEGSRVGWMTVDEYEDEVYSCENCLVLHYDNDSRTFAFNSGILTSGYLMEEYFF